MSQQNLLWQEVIMGSQSANLLNASMSRAAYNLSEMVGRPISINIPEVEMISISQVMTLADNPEMEIVGVYLLIEGELYGQALLMFPLIDAMYLVDLLMELPRGTTTGLDDLTRSALAEIGNLMLAGFLNALSELTGKSTRPSPPAVVVDMHSTILELIATSIAAVSDDMMVIETVFKDANRAMQFRFWVLPDPTAIALEKIQKEAAELLET